MTHRFIISSFLLILLSFCNNRNVGEENGLTSIENDSIFIYDHWEITRFTAGLISEITEKDAQNYVGQIIILKSDMAIINGDTCKQPEFKNERVDSDKYFYENNRVDKAALEIKRDSIQIIEVGCKENPKYSNESSPNFLYDFIVVNRNLMVLSFKGFYFYLERVNRRN